MLSSFKHLWSNKHSALLVCLFCLVALAVGILLGMYVFSGYVSSTLSGGNCPTDLKFVKPEQDCNALDNASNKMGNLQDDLVHEANTYLNTGRVGRISIFVRDLNSQRFAIVNPSEEFYMASLLKVPLAIAYYRLAEITPDLLAQQIVYKGDSDQYALQDIQPPVKLVAGTAYTVKDLIYRMLAYSDNAAADLLTHNFVSDDYLQKILFTLGLLPREKGQTENMVTAMSFAGIFRTLYNSSFLSRAYSDEILKALTQSSFADGATKNLPKSVTVAHKFGERSVIDPATGQATLDQLHECGVVYGANGTEPYSFCILTEGKDFASLESAIQNISATIYGDVVQ